HYIGTSGNGQPLPRLLSQKRHDCLQAARCNQIVFGWVRSHDVGSSVRLQPPLPRSVYILCSDTDFQRGLGGCLPASDWVSYPTDEWPPESFLVCRCRTELLRIREIFVAGHAGARSGPVLRW